MTREELIEAIVQEVVSTQTIDQLARKTRDVWAPHDSDHPLFNAYQNTFGMGFDRTGARIARQDLKLGIHHPAEHKARAYFEMVRKAHRQRDKKLVKQLPF